jgi:heat shock protein HslJ
MPSGVPPVAKDDTAGRADSTLRQVRAGTSVPLPFTPSMETQMIQTTSAPRRLARAAVAALATGALAIGLVACSSGSGDLTGKTWQLTSITEKTPAFQGGVPAAEQAKYTVTFNTDGTYNATADCNPVSGKYTTSGSTITIEPGAMTMMACPEGSFGDLFAHGLTQATTYAIANNELTLTLKDGGTMVFAVGTAPGSPAAATEEPTAAAQSPAEGLIGKAWELTAITEKVPAFQGVLPAEDAGKYTIEFMDDGTYAAKADCNQLAGTYTATAAGEMTINPGASTMAYCGEGSLADLYVIGLTNTQSYAIADGLLTLTLADGGTLQFK